MKTSAKVLITAVMISGAAVASTAPANAGFGASIGIGGPGGMGITRTTVHVDGIGNTIYLHRIAAMITSTASGAPTFTMTEASFSATVTTGGVGATARTTGTGGRMISTGAATADTMIVPTGMAAATEATRAAVRTGVAASAAVATGMAARRAGTAAAITPARRLGTTTVTAAVAAR